MKKYFLLVSLLLFVYSPTQYVQAEEGYSDFFISVGDAIIKTKADEWESVNVVIDQLNTDWENSHQPDTIETNNVDKNITELKKIVQTKEKQQMLDALTMVSHSLVALEKLQNPVDNEAERAKLADALLPVLTDLKVAVHSKDIGEIRTQYKQTLATWNRNELIVREQNIAYYGKIETQLAFLRITLTQDDIDYEKLQLTTDTLAMNVDAFLLGEELPVEDSGYSLQTLVDLLAQANDKIDEGNRKEAISLLQDFIVAWPSVEGEVRTRNGSLYTKLESEIPIIAGKLSSENVNIEEQQSKVKAFQQSIQLLQKKTSYTIWDAALIMLREGLEALLIVTALIAFLRKANVPEQQKWIWIGAFAGLVMSVLAAIVITVTFSAATAGSNRELIEGITGIVAVFMMIGVGMWLHQKSNMNAWNSYIKKHIGTAISTGSVVSMALVSFLSIFREGAETIIFYMGMAPSMSTIDLLTGIGIALLILIVFAIVFIRYSSKIAIGPFFKLATVLIYALAFKILGVSIHALQLTGHIDSTQIYSMPIISWIGFYPTWETILPQAILILIIILVALKLKRNEKNAL